MSRKIKANLVGIVATTAVLTACSGEPVQPHASAPDYIVDHVDFGGPNFDFGANRPAIDLFARGGRYYRVVVTSGNESTANLVAKWLAEDGLGPVEIAVEGTPDQVALDGYRRGNPANGLRPAPL